VDKQVGGGYKLCDPSLIRAILSALETNSHKKALYKRPIFFFLFFNTRGRIRNVQTVRPNRATTNLVAPTCWKLWKVFFCSSFGHFSCIA